MAAPTIEVTASNDPQLARLLGADEREIDREIERLIAEVAEPLIQTITGHAERVGTLVSRDDAEDIAATIRLRMVAKLRALARSPDEAVRDLQRYVATLTHNVVNDHLRKAFPLRTRLKNRLRYVLTHDRRLALWEKGGALACGLAAWRDSDPLDEVPLDPFQAGAALRDRNRPADAVAHLFESLRRPVVFDALVSFMARVWDVVDTPGREAEMLQAEAPEDDGLERMEARQYLRALWAEILQLRPMQRTALLLNLRGEGGEDMTALLVLTGVAGFEEVASALEMTPAALKALWNELPLDDLRIAAHLGVTRQQVINLRRSARERLTRRMAR